MYSTLEVLTIETSLKATFLIKIQLWPMIFELIFGIEWATLQSPSINHCMFIDFASVNGFQLVSLFISFFNCRVWISLRICIYRVHCIVYTVYSIRRILYKCNTLIVYSPKTLHLKWIIFNGYNLFHPLSFYLPLLLGKFVI